MLKRLVLIVCCCCTLSNYVNMDNVVKIETTTTGALLTFDDGTGYYVVLD